ncbi:hypothetical protein QBC39DRAFT_176785 [Podospora conica]|nr:hypothetical protein QBC39DRAFT_176785 [Schizothecium conicum]
MAAMDPGARVIDNIHWIAINTGCFAASNAISRTLLGFKDFVRDVRESRAEVEDIASLLQSLDGVLDILRDDADAFPPQLARLTPALLERSCEIIGELHGCISVLGRAGIPREEKKARWTASREHIGKLEATLLGYKTVLALAVDLVAITRRGQAMHWHYSVAQDDFSVTDAMHDDEEELAIMASRIGEASAHLQQEAQHNGALGSLRWYLDALQHFAICATEMEGGRHDRQLATPFRDAADSAVAMGRVESPIIAPADYGIAAMPLTTNNQVGDIYNEQLDRHTVMPQNERPPTPPPRSRARSKSAPVPRDDSFTGIVIPALPQSPWTPPQPLLERRLVNAAPGDLDGGDGARRSPQYLQQHAHVPASSTRNGHSRRATEGRLSSAFTINDVGGSSPDTQKQMQAERQRWHGLPQGLSNQQSSNDVTTTVTASSPSSNTRERSKSSRFSSFMSRSLSLRRNRAGSTPAPPNPHLTRGDRGAEPVSIFGCSLGASMEVARGLAPVTHPSGQTTTQSFPLCVLRCVYFIRSSSPCSIDGRAQRRSGLTVPHIFATQPSHVSLSHLIDIFSTPSTGYGKSMDWSAFNVHDAAALILHFIASLPSPLVPETTVTRWVSMSRQATVSGTAGTRVEQGLDFWEEALLGIKGGRGRGLVKLLLGLWGEIAQQAEVNEMTAERLAGCVLQSLVGAGAANGKNATRCLLGLAFLIRRRAEDTASIGRVEEVRMRNKRDEGMGDNVF